jgi:hypothetical protein
MALPVVVGVALGVGCLLIFCVGGMLAAIAIPNFLAMQLRAKRSELPSNVDALRTAEKAYHAEWDVFTTVEPCPPTWMSLGREQVAWDSTWDCYSQFEALGWTPYGMTRGRYAIVAAPGSTSSDDDFRVTGEADIDGDGDFAVYAANRAEKATMETYNNIY